MQLHSKVRVMKRTEHGKIVPIVRLGVIIELGTRFHKVAEVNPETRSINHGEYFPIVGDRCWIEPLK